MDNAKVRNKTVSKIEFHYGNQSFIIIMRIIVSFIQGSHTHIPETNHVPRGYIVTAILYLLFMVLLLLLLLYILSRAWGIVCRHIYSSCFLRPRTSLMLLDLRLPPRGT